MKDECRTQRFEESASGGTALKFIDFSPPRSPSLDQQRDALRKGLGRAVQWASVGCLADEPLLDACLKDQRHDMQIDGCRAKWLWQIIELLDAKDRFRAPIFHALYVLADARSAYQLCELGYHYANAGDEAFLSRLYEIVEDRIFTDYPELGESEILRLDGQTAFEFIARLRGEELFQRDWDWYDGTFVDEAEMLLGESEVREHLRKSDNKALGQFRELWDLDTQHRVRPTYPTRQERMRSVSVDDILSEARKDNPSIANFRGWGMCAADSDLNTVLEQLWASTEPTEIACLLRIFSNRALPTFDSRLIELGQHTDENVRRWAFNAMENNSVPAIHQFALRKLRDGDRQAIGLFIKNYEPGDEQTILKYLKFPNDQDELHWMLFDVIKVLENNPNADASRLGVVAYASTPCGQCRMSAAQWLHQHQVAPDWLTEECRFDSVEETRAKVASLDRKTRDASE